ncbi:MAG: universal stress protein [Candidatus Eremiobacteraeota bacterium]|nr:universal stress protein [Candidatus Eremiobacteraeota bacterium]
MIKSILVPMGDTEHSSSALQVAIDLAKKADAVIRGVYVKDLRKIKQTHMDALPYPTISPDLNQSIIEKELESVITEMDEEEDKVAQEFYKIMKDFDGEFELTVELGDVAEVVLKHEKAVDLIVMGKSRKASNPKTPVLGRSSRAIIQKSYRSALVITKGKKLGNRILLAYGGSPTAGKALRETATFAKLLDAKVYTICVMEDYETAEPHLNTVEQYLRPHGVKVERIWKKSNIVESIIETVKEKEIDFLVMGAYGHNTWKELIFGNNTEKVIEKLNIPLLLCS